MALQPTCRISAHPSLEACGSNRSSMAETACCCWRGTASIKGSHFRNHRQTSSAPVCHTCSWQWSLLRLAPPEVYEGGDCFIKFAPLSPCALNRAIMTTWQLPRQSLESKVLQA